MLYPANIEEKIGFSKIKEKLSKKCEGEYGRALVDKIKFRADFDTISKLINQTDEFLKIIQSNESFPGGDYFNIDKYLLKASKFDAYLLSEEFHELKLTLNNVSDILKFFKKRNEEYQQLSVLTIGVYINPEILNEINRVVDERGNLRNSASDDLLKIRNKLQNIQSKVRGKLERILKKFTSEGYAKDDASITIRNGRLVIPVRAEFKRVVGGFIHDESATGQTAFIEPSVLVELNNDVRDLMYQEKREIIRILTALTDSLRPELSNLHRCSNFLGIIDFIRAKARFAMDINGILPEIQNSAIIDWQDARHPLLYLSYKDSDKHVVPVNIFLSGNERILVISGPNAGGKSVCLQSVGLIQYMFQCGLLVPMYEGSTMGIFQQLFIDIGDEQSIENDLSTYSSHLVNMNYFIQYANQKTLFLIDEFGTGTEPQFGGAIAESILDLLRKKKSFGLITTHYTNLKKYAENHEGIVNGAMRFDIEKMEALFELVIGKPGSSFALEIAEKIGLPGELISQAKKNIGTTHVKFERLLGELEQEKGEYENQKKRISIKEEELKNLVQEYESLKTYIENKQDRLIKSSREEAERIIQSANKEIEKTIRIIKEEKADKEKTRQARKNLSRFKDDLGNKKPESKPQLNKKTDLKVIAGKIEVNDYVRIKGQTAVGMILSIKNNTAEIAIGNLKSSIKISRLEKISTKDYKELSGIKEAPMRSKGINISEKLKNFDKTLDVRGQRVEQALKLVNNFLDEALLLGFNDLRILHGKGDGILREVIRKHILEIDFVQNAYDEHVDRGGAGITVIELK